MSGGALKPASGAQSTQKLSKVGVRTVTVKNDEEVTDNVHPTPSYIETRFESHVKTLINRTDRLESLMERLLEASLANNELIGEMFKEMKTFMNKQDQTSTQSYEKPTSVDVKPADEETRLEDDRMEEEEVVEPPIKIIRKESSIRISEEPKVESDAEFIPVEIIESEDIDENYSDEKPEHEYLEDTSDQLQQKAFHLPLKTVEELLMFDQELKASADFRNDMKEVTQTNISEDFNLRLVLLSIIDKKLIKKISSQNNNSRLTIRKSYLCETFLYETSASAHQSRKSYINELNQILNIKPMRPDPDGINLPIETESDLAVLNNRLKNPEDQTKFVQKLINFTASNLKGKPLIVSLLSKILNVNMIMMHNWEGKHGKKKLSEYHSVFIDCMREAVDMDPDEFEGHMKKAIRTLQNREHIHISRVKKRLSTIILE